MEMPHEQVNEVGEGVYVEAEGSVLIYSMSSSSFSRFTGSSGGRGEEQWLCDEV
jgi:hypothetical protein